MHVHDEIRDHLLRRSGVLPWDPDSLKEWQICKVFHERTANRLSIFKGHNLGLFRRMAINRMVLGFFRYGPMYDYDSEDPQVYESFSNSMLARLDLYKDTGNLETLIDIFNLAMIEYARRYSSHPSYYQDRGNSLWLEKPWRRVFTTYRIRQFTEMPSRRRIDLIQNIIILSKASYPFTRNLLHSDTHYNELIQLGILLEAEFYLSRHPKKHLGDGFSLPDNCRVISSRKDKSNGNSM